MSIRFPYWNACERVGRPQSLEVAVKVASREDTRSPKIQIFAKSCTWRQDEIEPSPGEPFQVWETFFEASPSRLTNPLLASASAGSAARSSCCTKMVARDGIEPPTPAFSGLRS